MKNYLFIILSSIIFISCQSNVKEQKINDSTTKVEIIQKDFNFGIIAQSDSVEHSFKIKNVGTIPLIIKSAKASCGCTVPEWSNKPIPPNEQGIVKIKFKPTNTIKGIINKSVVVQANTDSVFHVLYIKGEVKKE